MNEEKVNNISELSCLNREYNSMVSNLTYDRKQVFTQKEIATFLEVGLSTIIRFEKLEIYDIDLLDKYAGILGYDIEINYKQRK